jgi:hypothetical protein
VTRLGTGSSVKVAPPSRLVAIMPSAPVRTRAVAELDAPCSAPCSAEVDALPARAASVLRKALPRMP